MYNRGLTDRGVTAGKAPDRPVWDPERRARRGTQRRQRGDRVRGPVPKAVPMEVAVNNKRAFTLIELLVVIVAVSLYSAGSFAQNCGWESFGSSSLTVSVAIVDPQDPTRIFQGGAFGVRQLVDGSWVPLGSALNDFHIHSMVFFDDGSGQKLYAAGVNSGVQRWDGTEWTEIASDTQLGASKDTGVSAMAVFDDGNGDKLYIGGDFFDGSLGLSDFACWDGTNWQSPQSEVINDSITTLIVWEGLGAPKLIVGGLFDRIGDTTYHHLATWDGSSWGPVGPGTPSHVYSASLHPKGMSNALIVAGEDFVAEFDGPARTLLGDLNGGLGLSIASFDDGFTRDIYVGGWFTQVDGVSANRIARWDGNEWTSLGSGVNGIVWSLSPLVSSNQLYVGGGFTWAGGQSNIQRSATWSNPRSLCAADVNEDCNLDFFDVSLFNSWLQAGDPRADFNGDGDVNFFDQAAFINAFNQGCP